MIQNLSLRNFKCRPIWSHWSFPYFFSTAEAKQTNQLETILDGMDEAVNKNYDDSKLILVVSFGRNFGRNFDRLITFSETDILRDKIVKRNVAPPKLQFCPHIDVSFMWCY